MMANSTYILLNGPIHISDLLIAARDGRSSAWVALSGVGLCFLYGARLATFLLRRQISSSYKAKMTEVQEKSDKMPLIARASITAFVAVSQAMYSIPLKLACDTVVDSTSTTNPGLALGALAVSALGLVIESVADEQKLAAKAIQPKDPVMTGMYSWCRHPNYSGEILFHIGMWGLTAHASLSEQLIAMVSPLFMVWVMLGAAKRLDRTADEKYGDNALYKKWAESTPSLVPGLR